eukprot:224686_1
MLPSYKHSAFLICVLLVATFCMLPLLQTLTNKSIVFTSYGFNNTHVDIYSYETQFTNISQNTITNTNCNPLYTIGICLEMKPKFFKRGFNIKCNKHERRDIFRSKPWKNRRKGQNGFDKMCFKYNRTNTNDNIFCDGGQLIYLDREWKYLVTDMEMKTSLHRILSTYCNKYHDNDKVCDFNLETYDIGIPEERIEFLTKHIDCNNNEPQYDKTWVFKENIDFGSGIHIYNNHKLIYQLITAG